MKTKSSFCIILFFMPVVGNLIAFSQALTGYSFKIVNMMPNVQSNETFFDSETNIAVNPANTLNIAGSAFTKNPSGSTSTAPIYVSADGGNTWTLNSIVPSGNGMTGDISISYGGSSSALYTGILRGGSSFRCMVLRTNSPGGGSTMTTLLDRSTESVDQPWVSATTASDASAIPHDRVFIGDNRYGGRKSNGGTGKTAEVMVSNDGTSAAPAGLATRITEVRPTFEEDFPAIRTAIHNSGVVYAIFYSWTSGNLPSENCDIVVVRDDNFASGTTRFQSLVDAGDSKAGQRVVTGRLVPAFGVSLGNNRLVGSNLAIAVDPGNAANVFIAWCDRVSTSDYTVHFRRSANSGQSWGSSDILTVTNATNPGIAVTTDGKVGIIYQQFTGSGSMARWETHFRLSTVLGNTFTDDILSTFLDNDLSASTISPSLGDYLRIQAVTKTFYGVFPASNRPDNANFPHSVSYQRNADFSAKQLRNVTNTANVSVSVDPFFFKISPSIVINYCQLHPKVCDLIKISKEILYFPPMPCLICPDPNPCLSCPFELPFEKIYEEVFGNTEIKTTLSSPYFHLYLEGFDPQNYDIKVTSLDGESIAQTLNKNGNGYTISFHASKKYFNVQEGLHDLKLTAMPKNAEAGRRELKLGYKLEASDFPFKEFNSMHK